MKCLIVDDDKFERDGIIYLMQRMNFPLVIREARNGKLALAALQQEKIDIVITDIKMPVMDGMAFLTEAKKIYPDCVYIIYSGYSDFTYAKQAISLKVLDFLVKPVSETEFHKVISQSIQIVEQENILKAEKFLISACKGEEDDLAVSLSGRFGLFAVERSELFDLEDFSSIIRSYNRKNIIFKIEECLYGLWIESDAKTIEKLMESFEADNFKTPIVFSGKMSTEEEIRKNCPLQLDFVKSSIFSVKRKFLMPDEWAVTEPFFDNIATDEFAEYLKRACFVTQKLLKQIELLLEGGTYNIKNQLLSAGSIEDLIKLFEETILTGDDKLIKEVKSYIAQNYQKEISIEDIAAAVFLNSSYLCTLFKKRTGITIIQYLTDYRIKEACALLKEGRLKNIEVANRVGYKNISYFNMVFKAKMHTTPSGYRKEFCHKR